MSSRVAVRSTVVAVLLACLFISPGVDGRRLLYSRAERREGNAAAAQQLAQDSIAAAARGDSPVATATAPNRLAVMMQDDGALHLANRILITKMEQREDAAAAAERFTAAQIEAATNGDKAVSHATAPQRVSAMMQDPLAGRILITKIEQREDNAAAAERVIVAQIAAAANGDKAVSDATAPQRVSAMMQDPLAGRVLITKMEQREDDAAAAERFTAAQIEAATNGDKAVSDATATQRMSAMMQDSLAGRILITKMEQREDNAAAAERVTVAQIAAAANGDKAVSEATAPQRVSAMMQDSLAGRILITKAEVRANNAAAAASDTADQIKAAANGDTAASEVTAPHMTYVNGAGRT